jgi:hypothetical protein
VTLSLRATLTSLVSDAESGFLLAPDSAGMAGNWQRLRSDIPKQHGFGFTILHAMQWRKREEAVAAYAKAEAIYQESRALSETRLGQHILSCIPTFPCFLRYLCR